MKTLTVIVSLLSLATADAQSFDDRLLSGLSYRNVGPSRGGRATTVTGVRQRPSTFYAGSTGGGVWKTTDYGQSWRAISDGFFETGSIGAIRVAPSDPDTVYVGTGSDGLRSNVITGRGVYKSVDAGRTWTFVGLRDAGQIGAVEIHPTDPNIAYVAAIGQAFGPNEQRGVYRTRDGGESWERVLHVSDRVGAVDLELAPDDPNQVYACMWRGERKPWTIISGGLPGEGGLYKSIDGGGRWVKLDDGLPSGVFGKSDLAVSAAAPGRVYVLIEAPGPDGGLYRSDDHGESFKLISNSRGLLDRPFYYCNIDADPSDADVLYVNATGFHKSTDGGDSWRRGSTPHGDNHDIWVHPDDPNLFIQANDGGVNVTRDGGATWSTQRNQTTAELYQVEVDDRFPYWLYAGQQDNSTIRVPSAPPYGHPLGAMGFWQSVGGCETGPAVPKPGDPDIVYANCKGRFGRFNLRTGQEKKYYVGAANMYGHNPKDLEYRFQRVSPIHVSPHDPNVVYHASQYLHRTTDEGVTWETISPDLTAFEPSKQVISGEPITRDITGEEFYSTIYAIRESKISKGLIWVGANDGPVHVTRNGGEAWSNVTPKDLPPGGRVDAVEPSPHRPEKAYVAVLRYQLGDWSPYVYRTNDYGSSWTLLTTGKNGIPADSPTRVIREDPDREGLLYVGTEFGLYVSFDDGDRWQSMQRNLPATPITDMQVHRKDLVISTMGRSFWILDDLTPLHQLTPTVANAKAHLFTPRDAYRTRSRGRGGVGVEYPQQGALIHYALTSDVDQVQIEIRDAKGAVIRTLSSSGRRGAQAPRGRREERGMRGPRRGARPARGLPLTAGMHRTAWDLRRDGIGGRGRGPMVLPGRYELRLTANGETHTAQLNLLMDPRVAADGVTMEDLAAQEALILDVAKLSADATQLSARLRRALAAADNPSPALRDLESKIITTRGMTYPTPMLLDQVRYLSSMVDGADQKPGRDAYRRLDVLRGRVTDYTKALEELR